MKTGIIIPVYFYLKTDTDFFNLQGDKGEAGAAGRDVSFAKSPLFYYYSSVFVLLVYLYIVACLNLPYLTPSFLYWSHLPWLYCITPQLSSSPFSSSLSPSSVYLSTVACSDIDITITLSLTAESIGFSEAATYINSLASNDQA